MTTPLVYIFAVAAGLLVLWLLLAAVLAYRHATTRGSRAGDLANYIEVSGGGMLDPRTERLDVEGLHQRGRVMNITIGDLVRDVGLMTATADGLARRRGMKPGSGSWS